MTTQEECIFCKIALKKIKTNIIIENDKAMAFLDAFPLSKGHTLVIPKAHYSKIQELDENLSQSLFNILWKITNPIEKSIMEKKQVKKFPMFIFILFQERVVMVQDQFIQCLRINQMVKILICLL